MNSDMLTRSAEAVEQAFSLFGRSIATIFALLLLLPFMLAFRWVDPLFQRVEGGNRKYAEGQFEEAQQAYADAQLDAPQAKELNYNIGNALYKQEKYDKALEEYQKALGSGDAGLESKILYNQGNAQFKLGPEKWQDSVNSYVEALKLNPEMKEAKYNLELVRKKIKEQLDKQEDQQQDQEQQQDQQQQDQQDNQDQDQQKQESQEGDDENSQSDSSERGGATPTPQSGAGEESGEENRDEEKEGEQEQESQAEAREMTKEEAERLLNSLENQDRQMEQLPQKLPGRGGNPEYDW